MILFRRLNRLTARYWRQHTNDRATARELASLAWDHPRLSDGDILRTWAAELEDRTNPEPW